MEYKISPEQNKKLTKTIQNFIDFELEMLKQTAASEDSEMSFDETHQIETIESIKVHSVDKKEKWIIYVDAYTQRPLYHYDEVLYHISYQLKKHIGPNEVKENQMIITQNFGPGFDY
jgi:hypothetical protein